MAQITKTIDIIFFKEFKLNFKNFKEYIYLNRFFLLLMTNYTSFHQNKVCAKISYFLSITSTTG